MGVQIVLSIPLQPQEASPALTVSVMPGMKMSEKLQSLIPFCSLEQTWHELVGAISTSDVQQMLEIHTMPITHMST